MSPDVGTAVKVSIFSASSSELVSEAGLGVDKTGGLVLLRFYFGVLARSSVFSSKGKSLHGSNRLWCITRHSPSPDSGSTSYTGLSSPFRLITR